MTFDCHLPEIHEEKIEDLNLIALRKYACAKVSNEKEWYMKCLECPGNDTCSCGRRVQAILEDVTSPEKSPITPKDRMFLDAFKSGDVRQYLVEHHYYKTKGSAGNAFLKWRKKTGLIPEEKIEAYKKIAIRRGRRNSGSDKRADAINRIHAIFAGTKTDDEKRISFLQNSNPEYKLKVLYNRASCWAKNYPELEEKYHFMEPCRLFTRAGNYNKTVAEYLKELQEENGMNEDEVSLDDFLKETEEPAEDFTPTLGEKLDKEAEKAHTGLVPSPDQLTLQKAFSQKRKTIREKLTELAEKKKKIDEEAAELQAQMLLLDKTAELFGMKAVASQQKQTP